MFPDPIVWKDGEEFSFNAAGHSFTEVRKMTKTGEVVCIKMGGKNVIAKLILLSDFYNQFTKFS